MKNKGRYRSTRMRRTMSNLLLLWFASVSFVFAQNEPVLMDMRAEWVESTLNDMTMDQKIGQLMMIRAHSDLGEDHIASVKKLIEDYDVGALCFFQGTPLKQAELTNTYQSISRIPLLVAIDGEWGLGMRFKKDVISYPRQLTLGAVRDNELIYDMGKEVAYELKRLGIHWNFAPVVDVNNNPKNPVINNRSFGEDRNNVAAKSYQYMLGMQDAGMIACAKHFPGHGDTDADSHYELPVINHDRKRLDSIELYPFQIMMDRGVASVMVAHLQVPALESRKNRPTSLSRKVVTGLLRDTMGYDGIIITDGMEMEAVTKHFKPGVAEAEAILAGNDMICLPRNVKSAVSAIRYYVKEGLISEAELDDHVRRILRAKYDLGLTIAPKIMLNELPEDILHPEGIVLRSKLFAEAVTLAKDEEAEIPFRRLDSIKFATVAFGSRGLNTFQQRVESYTGASHINLSYNPTPQAVQAAIKSLSKVDHVLISTEDMSKYSSKNFGISKTCRNIISQIEKIRPVTLVIFGSPYSLKYFDDYDRVVMSYTDDSTMMDKTAQAIFGAAAIQGSLPVTASEEFKYGQGERRVSLQRLGFAAPEEVGMSSDTLLGIDELVDEMIAMKAAPGCQIFVAKNGQVVFNKAYGTHDYSSSHPVQLTDVYDVASVTKIAASTVSIMQLYDQGRLDIDGTLQPFVTGIDTTDKKDKTIRDMMAHHAGLAGWIPFYKSTIDLASRKTKPLDKYYRSIPTDSFHIQVASNLFMRTDYIDSMWARIVTSDLRKNTNYRYSDLAFYMIMRVVESQSNMKLDQYCTERFYQPLGMRRTCFNPRNAIPLKEIVPSEKDNYFRNQVIKGYVHDMGAAMLGGVSGHAGLFSSSYDLGILMQMLLNGGYYGGESYFKPKTVIEFTTRYPASTRRGIGFDMKELDESKYENMSPLASASTFGHLGFTGTCVFADPENELVYVLLSNRTYPTMENNAFGRKNFRPRIQSVIYNSITPTKIFIHQGAELDALIEE